MNGDSLTPIPLSTTRTTPQTQTGAPPARHGRQGAVDRPAPQQGAPPGQLPAAPEASRF